MNMTGKPAVLSRSYKPLTRQNLKRCNHGDGQIRIRDNNGLFFADNGYIGSKDDKHRILFRRLENKIELREYGDLIFSPGSTDGEETAKVVMKADGKMGVGTESPSAQLDVFTSLTDPAIRAQSVSAGIGGKFLSTLRTPNSLGLWVGSAGANIIEGHVVDSSGNSENLRFIVNQTGDVQIDGKYQSPAADFAESVRPIGDKDEYEPGDVLAIGSNSSSELYHYGFTKSHTPYSTSVADVYSTEPGFIGGAQDPDNPDRESRIPMAVVGIVPCKVSAENGPIKQGDLLVTSSTPGYAMRGTDRLRMLGAIVGKALGELDTSFGIIDVLVTLQ